MIPLILISDSKESVDEFIRNYIKNEKILTENVTTLTPQTKEYSINQIKDVKKRIIFGFTQTQLYILYDFDRSSYEAQNAFLKTLEEGNQRVQFILTVRNYHSLAPTIISRSKLVYLSKNKAVRNTQLERILNSYFEDGELGQLLDFNPGNILKEKPGKTFEDLISYFRDRMREDKKSADILKEVIKTRFQVENNNIDPALALDHLMIFIHRTYSA